MAGRFEVYKDAKGKHRFRLKAGNGQIIAVGEAYDSMSACMNGIESIRSNAPAATVVDMTSSGATTKPMTAKPMGAKPMGAKPMAKPTANRKTTVA
jgi:uncharacterized protein YegP (UPF0339 family)